MVNWNLIDTVLIDMDGTLLDLYFDNLIWEQLIPQKYASINNISIIQASLIIVNT